MDMETGHCFGCGRTRDEIANWINYSPQQRSTIMEELPPRVNAIKRRPRRMTKRRQMAEKQNKSAPGKNEY